jgi:hypothetical protein
MSKCRSKALPGASAPVVGRCDTCGAATPRPTQCIFTVGTYAGHRYLWKRGRLLLAAVRCEAHPEETSTRNLDTAI